MSPVTSKPAGGHRVAETAGLDALFNPRTVALIGASEQPGSVGRGLLENLHSFPGPLFPINPRHDFLLDRRAFPSLSAVPEKIDLAVIATPAVTVPGVVAECVQAGIPAAIVISAGFKECGPAGVQLEQQVLTEARRGKLRLIGPNCLGVLNPHSGLNATFAATTARPGHVAFLSQSGALCSAVLDWSHRENIGFSTFASVGSMLDVGWGDLIGHLHRDPLTHSILLYMESVGDARSFLAAARAAALTKPVIVLKAGRTQAAAQAAASHTGALTGRDDVLDAALRRAGVLRVDTVADLFGMAGVLSSQPAAAGPRLAIVTNAGGPGALAADALVLGGGEMAPLSAATMTLLDELLPRHWSHGNPIDILGDALPDRFARTVEIAMNETGADGTLAILTPQVMTDPTAAAERLKVVSHQSAKPLLACWMGGDAVATGRRILHEAGIPTFAYPEAAVRTFDYLWRFGELRRNLHVSAYPGEVSGGDDDITALINAARQAGRSILSEHESKVILTRQGIPSVETHLASTVDEAVIAAAHLGYPVALKLHSHTITHKSDVDGVCLNVCTEAGVREAWSGIRQSVTEKAGPGHFLGVTVQSMVRFDGLELIVGSNIDPQFGPVLLFGAGGQFVEVFKDYALDFPPLDADHARRLMERTRIFAALQTGVRGRPPVNLPLLEQLLMRFSQLVAGQPGIKEIDLNPLVFVAGRPLALDARIILQPADVTSAQLPRPVLLP